jgi:hypothetical protein
MPRRYTGIRLLLVIVAINIMLFGMLVAAITSEHPWLAGLLPGKFGAGVNSSGYWVFFALVLLVNAVTVLIAGLVLLLPGMRDGAPSDECRLARHLVDCGGVAGESKESVLLALREEAVPRTQIVVGRAPPDDSMFKFQCFEGRTLCKARIGGSSDAEYAIKNSDVTRGNIEMFTLDQIAGAVLLDVYDWRFGSLSNNTQNPLFSHFVFAFRTLVGLVTLLIFVSFGRRRQAPEKPKKVAVVVAEAEAET